MRTRGLILFGAILLPVVLWAQGTPAPKPQTSLGPRVRPFRQEIRIRHGMGKWWKDSEIAKKLQLNDNQVAQLDQVFYDHKLKLIDFGAEMEKEDLKLQTLLDADVPNEGQISSQVDQTLSARGKLEREYTMMNLDLRKVLSLDQWRQLKAVRAEHDPGNRVFYFKKRGPGTREEVEIEGPPGAKFHLPVPPPPPSPEDMF